MLNCNWARSLMSTASSGRDRINISSNDNSIRSAFTAFVAFMMSIRFGFCSSSLKALVMSIGQCDTFSTSSSLHTCRRITCRWCFEMSLKHSLLCACFRHVNRICINISWFRSTTFSDCFNEMLRNCFLAALRLAIDFKFKFLIRKPRLVLGPRSSWTADTFIPIPKHFSKRQ